MSRRKRDLRARRFADSAAKPRQRSAGVELNYRCRRVANNWAGERGEIAIWARFGSQLIAHWILRNPVRAANREGQSRFIHGFSTIK